MNRIRIRAASFALIFLVPAALAGCFGGGGGGGGNEDPQQVLDQTFSNPTQVTSGHLEISLSGSAQGATSGDLSATIDGSFQGEENDPTGFPQFDLNGKVSLSGGGQSFDFDGGLIATQDNAYVEYQGQAYEVGSDVFQQFKRAYEQSAQQAQAGQNQSASSFFKQFGVDPSSWLTNLSNEGDEDIEGESTVHIHGDADVGQIVSDFGKISSQVPGAGGQALTPGQLDQLKSAVQEASVDVYSGKDDHILRKLALSLRIAPPETAGLSVSGVDVDFSITFSDVNQPQTVTAPSGAKPISELLTKLGLGGIGPFGGLGGGGSGGATTPGAGPSTDYLKCIQQAKTPDEINACAAKIQ